jgi:hypothetical protein
MVMKYREYRDLVKKTNNPIGALVLAFKELHDDAPIQDFEDVGGRMAGICKYNRNDYGLVMKIVWDTCSCGINGSHLNYIQAMITRNNPHLVKPSRLFIDNRNQKQLDVRGKCLKCRGIMVGKGECPEYARCKCEDK